MRWKRRRETDRRPSAKEKKMSPASSPLVPVTSRPLSLFGATEESASAVVHFCTHLTDGRRGGRTTTTTAGAKGAREKEEEKTNFFLACPTPTSVPSSPPLPSVTLRRIFDLGGLSKKEREALHSSIPAHHFRERGRFVPDTL